MAKTKDCPNCKELVAKLGAKTSACLTTETERADARSSARKWEERFDKFISLFERALDLASKGKLPVWILAAMPMIASFLITHMTGVLTKGI